MWWLDPRNRNRSIVVRSDNNYTVLSYHSFGPENEGQCHVSTIKVAKDAAIYRIQEFSLNETKLFLQTENSSNYSGRYKT